MCITAGSHKYGTNYIDHSVLLHLLLSYMYIYLFHVILHIRIYQAYVASGMQPANSHYVGNHQWHLSFTVLLTSIFNGGTNPQYYRDHRVRLILLYAVAYSLL